MGIGKLALLAQPHENPMTYFAYGSNMLTARLLFRCPGAEKIEPAFLTGYTLCFDKRSRDGSGKCSIRHTGSPSDVVHGVLFTIPQSQVPSLDRRKEKALIMIAYLYRRKQRTTRPCRRRPTSRRKKRLTGTRYRTIGIWTSFSREQNCTDCRRLT